MRKHGKYNPDYKKLYPDTEISAEIISAFEVSDRKMRYMEVDLKREKFVYKPEEKIARLLPGREDSYDRLCDDEHYGFPSSAPSPEEELIRKDELRRLHSALEKLKPDELQLITAIFFEGMTEREYANSVGKHFMTIHNRKVAIQRKLKKYIESEK